MKKLTSINRIRLEFKDVLQILGQQSIAVLIESDWNLKKISQFNLFFAGLSINRIRLEFKVKFFPLLCERSSVLIESDWNLKRGKLTDVWLEEATVLIESDWNLKRISVLFFPGMGRSINRIRLEFKDGSSWNDVARKIGY